MDADVTFVPTINFAGQASSDRPIIVSTPEETDELGDLTINFMAEGAD